MKSFFDVHLSKQCLKPLVVLVVISNGSLAVMCTFGIYKCL